MKKPGTTPGFTKIKLRIFFLLFSQILWSCAVFAQPSIDQDTSDIYVVKNNYPIQSKLVQTITSLSLLMNKNFSSVFKTSLNSADSSVPDLAKRSNSNPKILQSLLRMKSF